MAVCMALKFTAVTLLIKFNNLSMLNIFIIAFILNCITYSVLADKLLSISDYVMSDWSVHKGTSGISC